MAAEALGPVNALPAHVVLETYSVLTRLPGGFAVPPDLAAGVLADRFPSEPFGLDEASRRTIVDRLAEAGVRGGAAYDGLVALEAAAHRERLLTLDARALRTYRQLGADFRLVGA